MFMQPATLRGRGQRQSAIRRNTYDLPSSDAVANILAVYDDSDQLTLELGERWYPIAHEFAEMLVNLSMTPITIREACGILAALSPNTSWTRNQELAIQMVETGDCSHLSGDAIQKARAILSYGIDPDIVLGGRKVRSFFLNILRPNVPGPLTMDRHAYDAAFNRKTNDTERKVLDTVGFYIWLSGCYRAAARQRNVPCSVMQATVWCRWRQLNTYNGGDF